jgi:hypothetical protein
MTRMKKTLLLFSLVLLLARCNSFQKGKKIDQLWFYSYSSNADEKDNPITPANFLSLQPDGSYTRDFGKFEEGSWEEKNSTLYLKGRTGVIEFPVRSLSANELQLVSNKRTILHFEAVARNFSSPADDPFSVANNQWRITAAKKENAQEIRSRLKNHFRFYELYFEWALDNHFQSIDVNSTPSLIKIYGNGFALKPSDELTDKWRSYFFDENDCNTASKLVKDIFEHHEILWPKTENKFKMFISAFQQLQQKLK